MIRNPLSTLAENFGYEGVMEMLEEAVYDSVVPAICVNCGTTYELEPDAFKCKCENCKEDKVFSALALAGVI